MSKEEQNRLNFIEERDGREAMLRWAEQTLALYVAASVIGGQYQDSIKEFTKVLEDNGHQVELVKVSPMEQA